MRKVVAVLLGMVLLGGCSESKTTKAAEGNKGRPVRLEGEINPSSVDRVSRELMEERGARVLQITSAGGHPLAAIRLAETIRDLNVTLVVDGYCLAACAQYAFMAAPSRIVNHQSLVAFHNNVVGGADLIRARGGDPPSMLSAAEQVDLNAYERWGVPGSSLLDQFSGLRPVCVEWRSGGPQTPPRFRFAAQMWTPPEEWVTYNSTGLLGGWWPTSQADVNEAARRVTQDLPSLKAFAFGGAEDWAKTKSRLAAVGCGGESIQLSHRM